MSSERRIALDVLQSLREWVDQVERLLPLAEVDASLGGEAPLVDPAGASAEPPSDLPRTVSLMDAFENCRREERTRAAGILAAVTLWPDPPCWCLAQGEHSPACEAARAYIAEAQAQQREEK